MNPHVKESYYVNYLDEKSYANIDWLDLDGFWVEVGGLALVICTVSISTGYGANVAFRLVDENDKPLSPYRTPTNNRRAAHFSAEPQTIGPEDITPVTFHMIVNCKYAKVQIRARETDRAGAVMMNAAPSIFPVSDRPFIHKCISTMTAIPLVPFYQPGANTIFTYPQSRMPRTSRMLDKPPVIHKDKLPNLLKKDSA